MQRLSLLRGLLRGVSGVGAAAAVYAGAWIFARRWESDRLGAASDSLLLFYLVCSVGLFANVGVAFSVYDQEPIWWLAGAAGALMGVVWNYAMSGLFVWRKR